jgi:Uncharacterized Fe-S protein
MMESWIKRRLLEMGFDDVGIVSLENFPPEEDKRVFLNWLEKGYHADMEYMERGKDARLNPNLSPLKGQRVLSWLFYLMVQKGLES